MHSTHEEIKRLIQFKADRALSLHERSILESHLAVCRACAEYAGQIKDMELGLRQVMQKHWSAAPLPFRARQVQKKKNSHRWALAIMPMRKSLIGITIMLFAFTIWQLAVSGTDSSRLPLFDVSPNPTPSLSITGTLNNFEACEKVQYTVQQGDTLESLADKFSVPVGVIAELNNLQTIEAGLLPQMIIPICTMTPTSTTHPPASTLTPDHQVFTDTPG